MRKPLTPEQKARARERMRKWRVENKAVAAARQAAWRKSNPEAVAEHSRRTRTKHKNKIRVRQAEWVEKNIEHVREKRKLWYQGRKDTIRDLSLRRTFGISLDMYNELLTAQGGVCALCSGPQGKRRFAVDHCHSSGVVRGLLCRGCNVGIGNLKDDPELLKRAIAYLEKHKP